MYINTYMMLSAAPLDVLSHGPEATLISSSSSSSSSSTMQSMLSSISSRFHFSRLPWPFGCAVHRLLMSAAPSDVLSHGLLWQRETVIIIIIIIIIILIVIIFVIIPHPN